MKMSGFSSFILRSEFPFLLKGKLSDSGDPVFYTGPSHRLYSNLHNEEENLGIKIHHSLMVTTLKWVFELWLRLMRYERGDGLGTSSMVVENGSYNFLEILTYRT